MSKFSDYGFPDVRMKGYNVLLALVEAFNERAAIVDYARLEPPDFDYLNLTELWRWTNEFDLAFNNIGRNFFPYFLKVDKIFWYPYSVSLARIAEYLGEELIIPYRSDNKSTILRLWITQRYKMLNLLTVANEQSFDNADERRPVFNKRVWYPDINREWAEMVERFDDDSYWSDYVHGYGAYLGFGIGLYSDGYYISMTPGFAGPSGYSPKMTWKSKQKCIVRLMGFAGIAYYSNFPSMIYDPVYTDLNLPDSLENPIHDVSGGAEFEAVYCEFRSQYLAEDSILEWNFLRPRLPDGTRLQENQMIGCSVPRSFVLFDYRPALEFYDDETIWQ